MAFSEEDGTNEIPLPCLDWALLDRYFNNELSEEEDSQVRDHIMGCDKCYKKFKFHNKLRDTPEGVWEVAVETAKMREEKQKRITEREKAEAEAKQNQLSYWRRFRKWILG